jgi:hypothetical protein
MQAKLAGSANFDLLKIGAESRRRMSEVNECDKLKVLQLTRI